MKLLESISPCLDIKRLCSVVLDIFQLSKVTRSTSARDIKGNKINKNKVNFFSKKPPNYGYYFKMY